MTRHQNKRAPAPVAGDAEIIDLLAQASAASRRYENLSGAGAEESEDYKAVYRLQALAEAALSSSIVGVIAKLEYADKEQAGCEPASMYVSALRDARRLVGLPTGGDVARIVRDAVDGTRLEEIAGRLDCCAILLDETDDGTNGSLVYLIDNLGKHVDELRTEIANLYDGAK